MQIVRWVQVASARSPGDYLYPAEVWHYANCALQGPVQSSAALVPERRGVGQGVPGSCEVVFGMFAKTT